MHHQASSPGPLKIENLGNILNVAVRVPPSGPSGVGELEYNAVGIAVPLGNDGVVGHELDRAVDRFPWLHDTPLRPRP